jgi:hypothetical protein
MCAFDASRPEGTVHPRFNVPWRACDGHGLSADPSWMRLVLNELRPLNKPVYITENGLASNDRRVAAALLEGSSANVLLSDRGRASTSAATSTGRT